MGLSAWQPNNGWNGSTPEPWEPGWPTPLPLLANLTVVEQPVDLGNLTRRYADFAADFITTRKAGPWYLYASLNHIHSPNSCAARWCGSTASAVTDAIADADWLVGSLLDVLDATGLADDTRVTVFFTERASRERCCLDARRDYIAASTPVEAGHRRLVILTSDNGAPIGNDAHGNMPLRGGKATVSTLRWKLLGERRFHLRPLRYGRAASGNRGWRAGRGSSNRARRRAPSPRPSTST